MLAQKQIQTDFSAGACPAFARHLIPENGVYAIQNGLLDDDGAIYKRGGSRQLPTTGFDWAEHGLNWIWDGYFGATHRTLVAGEDGFAVIDDAGETTQVSEFAMPSPVLSGMLKGVLFIGGGQIYAGSPKWGDVFGALSPTAVTNGSPSVVGTGTTFGWVKPGMLVVFGGTGTRAYVVKSVEDDTHLTLTEPYAGATSASIATGFHIILDATVQGYYPVAPIYTVCGQRIIACKDNVWRFSAFDDPHTWNADDNWELPEGVVITGAIGIDNDLTLFTTQGIWRASNVEQEPTDFYGNPQHGLRQVTRDLILWSAPGIATWAGSIIMPAADGVWMISGSSYEKISKSYDKKYVEHVHRGRKAGQAVVFNAHYMLPILDDEGQVLETLVCRLDRPTRVRGQTIYPWSTIQGTGAQHSALTTRAEKTGAHDLALIGTDASAPNRVLDLSDYFEPADTTIDHDDTVPQLVVETRNYPTGPLTENFVKAMRLGYRLIDAFADNPVLHADWSSGEKKGGGSFWGKTTWGGGYWTSPAEVEWEPLDDVAPEDDGRTPKFWRLRRQRARARYVAFRLRSANQSSECVVRSLEVFTRKSGRL